MLLGRCDEHALVPFQPWIEALERLLDALPAADADHWLTAHDGALARLLPARSAAQAPPGGPRERYLAFELVRALLEDVAARRPVLLVLDDVHWADADSLALLRHVARVGARRAAARAAVRARGPSSSRPSPRRSPSCAASGPLVSRRPRRPRRRRGGRAARAAHRAAIDHGAARRYRARSGGNPFFLEELLREAQEAGGDARAAPRRACAT